MSIFVCVASLSLVFHMTHGYILLTANLDDLHGIVKELSDSPMSAQIGSILRRAYTQFGMNGVRPGQNQEYMGQSGFQMRADVEQKMDNNTDSEQGSGDGMAITVEDQSQLADTRDEKLEPSRRKIEPLLSLLDEKDEKYYIKSINKVLDGV